MSLLTDSRTVPARPTGAARSGARAAPLSQGRSFSVVPASLLLMFFMIPVVALAIRWADLGADAFGVVSIAATIDSLLISLRTTLTAVLVTFVFGTPLAWILATREFKLKPLVTVFVELPLVMPPVVAGLALLIAFGRNGLVGQHLADAGITVAMTRAAVVMAQVFVASPYYIRAAQLRFASIPWELREAAGIDGASERTFFWRMVMPLSAKALVSGMILTWARALGEFGATVLFAGNLAGLTRTMPSLVYIALEQHLGASFTVAMVLLVFAGLSLALVRTVTYLDDSA